MYNNERKKGKGKKEQSTHNLDSERMFWITWMGSSSGCGRAKGWTNKANCIADVDRRSAVHGT